MRPTPLTGSAMLLAVLALGVNAAKGGVDRFSHDLVRDASLEFPGCMGVGDLMLIHIAEAE